MNRSIDEAECRGLRAVAIALVAVIVSFIAILSFSSTVPLAAAIALFASACGLAIVLFRQIHAVERKLC